MAQVQLTARDWVAAFVVFAWFILAHWLIRRSNDD